MSVSLYLQSLLPACKWAVLCLPVCCYPKFDRFETPLETRSFP